MRVDMALPAQLARASWAGNAMSTRIAINPRPEGLHNYDAAAGASQLSNGAGARPGPFILRRLP